MNCAMAGTLLAILAGSAAFAQEAGQIGTESGANKQDTKLEFEVASIKLSPPPGNWIMMGGRGGPGSGDPGRLTYSNMNLMSLITMAYGVRSYQVQAGSNSLTEDRFDITAKVPAGASKDDVKVMMQNLLAERFKLAVHHETKELPIYALVVGKNGPKIKESSAVDTPAPAPAKAGDGVAPSPPGPPRPKIGADGCPSFPETAKGRMGNMMMMTPNGACMLTTGGTMDGFAAQLSNWFDRPVLDMTGLKGKYDYKLRYDPASTPGRGGPMMIGMPLKGGGPPGDPARMAAPDSDREPAPSIFSALQEQLGLKLDSRKAPIDLVVIDHVEKTPTEN